MGRKIEEDLVGVEEINYYNQNTNFSSNIKMKFKYKEDAKISVGSENRRNFVIIKLTESAHLASYEHTETELKTREPAWDWPRHSACMLELYSLILLWNS